MNDAHYQSEFARLPSTVGEDAVNLFGDLVDAAERRGDRPALERLLAEADRIRQSVDAASRGRIEQDYFTGNALSTLHRIDTAANGRVMEWEQPILRQAIYHYRSALTCNAGDALGTSRLIQCIVNLGNSLSHVGRSLDAVEQYDSAIRLCPTFGMAVGNRGFALMHFAMALYDPSHRFLMMRQAWKDLSTAVTLTNGMEADAADGFENAKRSIESWLGVDRLAIAPEWPTLPIGETEEERSYRKWCYIHRLFVNDTADALPAVVSATDITALPSIVSPIQTPIQFQGLFNLMKQELVTARWLCYEGLNRRTPHLADREVLIYDTLDYPCHTISVDQIRIGLRSAFSVLDKIGLFVNTYWNLGHDPKQVYFRSVWYEKRSSKNLHPTFRGIQNWPLRGLYWLSLDLVDEELQEVLEPQSQSLQALRHKLEHQFVKVVEAFSPAIQRDATTIKPFADPEIVLYISRPQLEAKAIRILQLVRRALIYLSMAVHSEEQKRASDRGNVKIGKLHMPPYPDEDKR